MRKYDIFFLGIMLGMGFFMLFSVIIGTSPVQQEKIYNQKAVDHGYAKWVVTTNGIVKFKWNNE